MSVQPAHEQAELEADVDRLVPLGAARAGEPPLGRSDPGGGAEDGGVGAGGGDPAEVDEHGETPPRRPRPILRDEHYRHRMVAGREVREGPLRRLLAALREALTSPAAREERELDARLRTLPAVSRQNVIAFISPRGGVGKTTLSFVVGSALAEFTRGSVLAVDGDSDYGPLANLAADATRSDRGLDEVLADFPARPSLAELRPYLSATPTGLRLLGAPTDPRAMERLEPEDYDRLLELLGDVETIILDCGAGLTKPLVRWAIARADQLVVTTKPDWVTANNVAQALDGVPRERTTLVLNQVRTRAPGDRRSLERHFARHELRQRLTVPYDEQLAAMLDSATYDLAELGRPSRLAVKELAATVGEGLR